MADYPKFEKANDNTIRVITEQVQDVPLKILLENKKQIEDKVAKMQETLRNINEILENAAKLGITVEAEEKKEENK